MRVTAEREAELRRFAKAVLEDGRKRRKTMKKLKVALQNGEDEKALDLARDLVGLGKKSQDVT